MKNTNIVFHIIKSTYTEIQECKLLTIFNGLFSITHHTVATEPRDSYLSSPTKLNETICPMVQIKSYYMLYKIVCNTGCLVKKIQNILSKNHNFMMKCNNEV